jgi:UDP-N-acetylmuramoylalanine--D-glutamate ligase
VSLPRRVLVLGLARQGQSAAIALARRGVQVVGVDRASEVDAGRLGEVGVEVRLGTEEEALLAEIDIVVKSAGVPNEAPLAAAARARGVPIWSDVELAARILPNPFLAVTGTNGKTTTTALLGEIFRAAGRDVAVAGNIGFAVCGLDGEIAPETWVVCELSSFQLEHIDAFRPRIAVLLNLEPDHLDRHGSYEAYRAAKLRVFENQHRDDVAVVPRGLNDLPGSQSRVEFSAHDPLPAEPRIPGAHNRENAAAATAAARAAALEDDAIAQALQTFPGVEHRLEPVAEIDGVRYVNDSKATNVAAALRGLASFDEPLRLILGGSLKGESFRALAAALRGRAGSVYLVGEASDEIASELDAVAVSYERAGELETAVRLAAAAARPGDIVLLSPACASYDQFENFEERGQTFKRLVRGLER